MQPVHSEMELRIFFEAHNELQTALRRHDYRAAGLAVEELVAIQLYSNWQVLRGRCAAAIAAYERHRKVA